jgi:hypothetical protein
MEALTPVALREESAVFIGQERTTPEKRLVHRRSALRKSRFIRPSCVLYCPLPILIGLATASQALTAYLQSQSTDIYISTLCVFSPCPRQSSTYIVRER